MEQTTVTEKDNETYEEARQRPLVELPAWAFEELLTRSQRRPSVRDRIMRTAFPPGSSLADCLKTFFPYKHVMVQAGLRQVFEGWEMRLVGQDTDEELPPATLYGFDTGSAERQYAYVGATFTLTDRSGKRLVAHVELGHSPVHCGALRSMLIITCIESDRELVTTKFAELEAWIRANAYIKGKAIETNGRFIPQTRRYEWRDLFLPDDIAETIRQNTQNFFERLPQYRKLSLPTRRGVLMSGKPGCGKTTLAKVLASQLKGVTFILAKPGNICSPEDIHMAFKMASETSPSLLLLEDLDMYAGQRTFGFGNMILGELLDALDGMHELDGVVTLATTNCLSEIDEALRERPNRFDVVLTIPDLSDDVRCRYLRSFVDARRLNGTWLDELEKATRGLTTIAQCQEAAIRLLQRAIESDVDPSTLVSPAELPDLEAAVPPFQGSGAMGFRA